jgi:hypothetical protein
MTDLADVIANSPVTVQPGAYCVAQLRDSPAPPGCFMVATDCNETTVIMREDQLGAIDPADVRLGYRLVEIRVATPFEGVGFLATICGAVADAGLNICVVSTFSADYILLKQDEVEAGIAALERVGFPLALRGETT